MKALFLLALLLSVSHGFNSELCEEDIRGLLVSYTRAVIDWNAFLYYKQAIQETGYFLQYLGAALINCNFLPVLSSQQAVLQMAGEELTKFDGTEEFDMVLEIVTQHGCEEKLQILNENSLFYLKTGTGVQSIMQSVYDFMTTCKVSSFYNNV